MNEDHRQIRKIFLTTGTQLPFDRLVECIDRWKSTNPAFSIKAQLIPGHYIPKNFSYLRTMSQIDFTNTLLESDIVISHAGMGTVITCQEYKKNLIVLPRLHKKGEHRNDHQVATSNWLRTAGIASIAESCAQIIEYLNNTEKLHNSFNQRKWADEALLASINEFIARN